MNRPASVRHQSNSTNGENQPRKNRASPLPGDDRLTTGRSAIDGTGCFSRVSLPARKKFGEFIGEKISAREARARVARGGRISICDLDRRWSIDASASESPTAFINHACRPNAYTRIAQGRIWFYALRRIEAGEEITLDYRPSQHPERSCGCGLRQCRGLMG
ncbi:MAG: SET domain-containing protein-lysine N-methyltransferase [Chthoniobacterales bacterium]|nr:SET domain-containing protein-lysine N-methyltransferase [Chthoniobacterales bacterium]